MRNRQAQLKAGLPAGDTDRLGPFLEWWLGTLEAKATADQKSVNTVDNATWAVWKWIVSAPGSGGSGSLSPNTSSSSSPRWPRRAAAGRR
jgi:hypothetical protein